MSSHNSIAIAWYLNTLRLYFCPSLPCPNRATQSMRNIKLAMTFVRDTHFYDGTSVNVQVYNNSKLIGIALSVVIEAKEKRVLEILLDPFSV